MNQVKIHKHFHSKVHSGIIFKVAETRERSVINYWRYNCGFYSSGLWPKETDSIWYPLKQPRQKVVGERGHWYSFKRL